MRLTVAAVLVALVAGFWLGWTAGVRHYRATRFQLGSKFAFDHLRAKDTSEQKALLEKLDERVSPAFAHDKRGGEDDSWIYAYDACNKRKGFGIENDLFACEW